MPNGIKLERFAGLLPRVPDTLLPPSNATTAWNCDFAYGELRGAAADVPEHALSANAVSIYTDDGTLFYSWDTDVNAVRSPMANDLFNRLYYTTTTDFRVASRAGMSTGGGEPPSSYRVGVPKPEAAPVVTVASGGGSVADAATNAGVMPVYRQGEGFENDSAHRYLSGGALGPLIVSASITLPAAGSIAVLLNWQSLSAHEGDNFGVGAEISCDGTVIFHEADSGISGRTEPHFATTSVTLAAGTHAIEVRFYNDYTKGWWFLGKWGLTVLPVLVEGETVAAADPPEDVTRAYVWTMVNIYGEEGPPSPPSMFTFPLGAVDVSVAYVPPVIDFAPLKELRIYRTPDSTSIAEYFYVGKIDVLGVGVGTVAFHDDVPAAELNESLASMNYYAPDPDLGGLIQLPNGILMAWKGNEMHFSDAYKPWSWPPQYRLTFGDYNVVGAIAVGASALVTTTGKPFVVAGVSPDSMTYSVLNTQQAGVSKWAIADLGGQIVYASHDGIVAFDGGLPTMAFSDNYFTREVWRARYGAGLAAMRFAVWDGRLIVYSGEDAFTAFMIGLDEARGAMTELPFLAAQSSFVSPVADQCFIVNGSTLLRVAGGEQMECNWISRTFVLPRPVNYSVAQAVCSGSWSVLFFADGVLRHTQENFSGNVTFRLPAGFTSDRWKLAIIGTGTFRELRVAETALELKAM